MKIKKSVSIFSFFLTLSLISFISVSHAATISGSIYESDGDTLITGDLIQVDVYQGDPCGGLNWVTYVHTDTGLYTTPNLPEGTYYLRTSNRNQSNYVNEWWANPSSTISCSGAQPITVSTADITGKDFQLDVGYSISGMVYQSDGFTQIPDNNVRVEVITGDPCDDREWMGNAETSGGAYTIMGIPPGDYYLHTRNDNQSNYVNEWWAVPASVISCGGAQSVTVSTANIIDKDFQLDDGYSISGMVYQSNGSTPIPDDNVRIEVITGDPCDDREYMGSVETSVGAYTIMGLPPGDYYLQARTNNQSIYAGEWWAESESVFYCFDAQAVALSSTNVTGKDFILDIGGSITGVVVNDSGAPQADLVVEYFNDLCSVWKSVNTDIDGSFEIIGLPPGLVEIEIEPDVDTGLAMYMRNYSCLASGESSDLGTIELQNGALITGVIQDADSNPLSDVDVWCGAKSRMGGGETEHDGSFAFRLPVGTFLLAFGDENDYSRIPVEITVSDVGTPEDLGIITSYDASSGEQISGTVNYGGYAGTGEFKVIAFLNTTEITPENFAGIQPIANAEPDQGTGEYSLYVVPQAVRPGTTVNVMLILIHGATDAWESVTVVDEIEGIVTSGTPVTGQDLAYSTSGSDYTVSGFIKNSDGGIVDATVLLFKQPGDEFFGFAETDCDGAYTIYNVPAGTYRIAATAYGYDATEWTAAFNVVDTNVTVPDIFMGSSPGDELTVDFSTNGLWHYSGSTWTHLAAWNPDGMAEWDGGLAVNFGPANGLWNYDGTTWNHLAAWEPEDGIAWNNDLAIDFGTNGLWSYDGSSWTHLAAWNPDDGMVEWTGGLAVDFGAANGLWNYDGTTWTHLAAWDPEGEIAWNNDLAVDFSTNGLWSYDGSWTHLAAWNPDLMVEWSGGLAVDFGAANGLWNYDGTTWTHLAAWDPEDDMVSWSDGIAVDFGPNGLWSYDGTTWTHLAAWNPEEMEGWANGLSVDFGATYGLWSYDGSSWTNLAAWDPEDIIDVDLY